MTEPDNKTRKQTIAPGEQQQCSLLKVFMSKNGGVDSGDQQMQAQI
jgi:hypothetical protein